MLSLHCSPLMPPVFAKPRHSSWGGSSLTTLPVSHSDSTQPPQTENHLTTTSQPHNPYDLDAFAPVKPENSSGSNLTVLRSSSPQGASVQRVQRMAVVDALGLNLGGEMEQTAGEHMLHLYQPHRELTDAMQTLEDDEDVETTASDPDDHPLSEGNTPKTAAEVRADKRRMKRFRLTHGQTRFLQSEFARQAHPDSVQRERLSREIPGLSPRQVQVWFQNRRAKMKRLLGDDRERMIKSRAVPEGFDTTRSLHSPYLRSGHVAGVPMKADEENAPPFDMTNPHRGKPISSPSSVSSNPDGSYAAASSVSTSEAMSPVSSLHETPYVSDSSLSPRASRAHSQPINRYSRSLSFPQIYHALTRPSNCPDLEQASRRRAESLAAPLGVGLPFADVDWDHSSSHRSRIDPASYPCTSHYSGEDLSNPFGIPAHMHPTAATQEICAPEHQASNSSDMIWPGFSISVSGPSPSHDIPASHPEFAVFSHTGSMIENFNGLQCSEPEALQGQGPPPFFLAEGDGTSMENIYYHHMNPAESYSAGLANPFLQ